MMLIILSSPAVAKIVTGNKTHQINNKYDNEDDADDV